MLSNNAFERTKVQPSCAWLLAAQLGRSASWLPGCARHANSSTECCNPPSMRRRDECGIPEIFSTSNTQRSAQHENVEEAVCLSSLEHHAR